MRRYHNYAIWYQGVTSCRRISLHLVTTVFKSLWLGGDYDLRDITKGKPAPKGKKWVFCRYRKVRGKSGKMLDAHDYGYRAWAFLVPA